MRAAMYHGRRDVRVTVIDEPVPTSTQVLIRVELCGICGTDLHEFFDGPVFCPTAEEPHPLTGESAPVVLGHEFVGIVERVGSDVSGFEIGERVVVEPRQSCGLCAACVSGQYNCCEEAATIGLQGGGGGLAELVAVESGLVFPIGRLSAEVGAIVEPLAVALHAVRRAGHSVEGRSAVVFGAGPIGLMVTWVLKRLGAATVVVVEPSEVRRARAGAFGADWAIDPSIGAVAEAVASHTDGAGMDLAFECAGKDVTLAGSLDAVRPGGTVVNVAIAGRPMTVDLLPLILKEINLVGTICYAHDHQDAIDLLTAHDFPIEQFITARIAIEDLVERGFHALVEDADQHVKILVAP